MPIIHVYKTNHDFRSDHRLSYKARGMLAYIMNHAHDWEVHVETLVKESDEDGRIAVQSGLQELLRWQYAVLETVRDVHGKVRGKQYLIYDVPLDMQPSRQAGNMRVGSTDKQETRLSENTSVGTDKQVNRLTGNLRVGEEGHGVESSPHRQAGFPSDGFPDRRETCLITKDKDLREREDIRENQDLPPIVPQTPQTKRARTKAAQHPNTDYTPGFNKAWALYPRKEKKVDTFTIWRERGLEARAAEIAEKIARLQVTLWHRKEMRYIPLPTTWFNESRYEDDLIPLDMAQEVELRERTSPREYNNLMAARRWQEEKFGTQRSPALSRDDGEVIDSVSYRIE